jgi:ATP-dependent DNA helicase RecQ
MDDRFALLQEIVLGRAPVPKDVTDFRGLTHQRLLRGLQGPTRASASDIAGLVRQVLRREEARQGGVPQEWWVPKISGWPTAEQWSAVGVELRSDLENRFRIRASSWMPAWLPGSEQEPPCQAVEAQEKRRNFETMPGDPWLSVMKHERYSCGAQREMMRGVLTAPPGATLLCNLPTGAGKSLLAQLPALLRSRREGLSVVVVPTTALAIDQERSVSGLVPHPTAYHPGTLPDGTDRRQEIRQRILEGTQRIVFTSPESVIGGLSGILYAAAERGLLRFFAIDEAHIVLEWGGEFRSSFQELAGLRRDLLRNCAGEQFVTLLMSATVSQECLRTLEALFAGPGPFAVSSAVQLRPEPSYWMSHCENEEIREARVLEAVHQLPRPLILYTTKRKDADQWYRRLQEAGYRRCARVTGTTPTEVRQSVVQRWKAADLDIVVATAAFGLGVDQGDVRAVVHACVPESVDRYYQEVGRGGRDGHASLSLVLYTDADLAVATRMSRKKLIGSVKGPPRWRRMFFNKEVKKVDEGLYRVPIGISPGVTATRIDMRSARNLAWNINTLTLMSRAGVLQMDAERPPEREVDVLDVANEEARHLERLKSHREHRVIRILDPQHLEPETWQRRVEPVRREAHRNSQSDLSRMRQALRGERCVAEILAEAYRIQAPGSGTVQVVLSCGGCSTCRAVGRSPYSGPLLEPLPPWPISREMGKSLARLFADSDAVAVFYDEVEQHDFERFLRWLVSTGIRNAVLPAELPSPLRSVALEVLGAPMEHPVFVSEVYHFRKAPRVPTLILHPNGMEVPTYYLPSVEGSGIPRVLFLPADATDPTGPHRRLRDVIPRKFGFSEFLLSQGL